MALNAYLTLKGQKQGWIKGSVTLAGRQGTIMVMAVSHGITADTESQSGNASDSRMHRPFVISKELDKSSPLLYNALCTNENLPEFKLNFYQKQANGTEIQHYTVQLINARIVDIEFTMLNTKNPDLVKYAEYEDVTFTYEKITWTWINGGIMASDDWETIV